MTGGAITRTVTLLCVVLLVVPTVIVIAASFTSGNAIVFPPRGFSFHAYGDLLSSSDVRHPVLTSAYLGLVSVLVGLFVGVPGALALNRYRVRMRPLINAFLSLGFATPLVVSAVGYLLIFTELRMASSLTAVGFAIAVVNLPFMLWSVAAAVGDHNPELEEAAATLGAEELKQFLLVTLPGIAPGIILGVFMMFIFAITEFTMSIILVTSADATLPVYMFGSLRSVLSAELAAVGSFYILVCIVVFFVAVRLGNLEQFLFRSQK